MKRYVLAAVVVLLAAPGVASAQMMGTGMSGSDAPSPPEARQGMSESAPSAAAAPPAGAAPQPNSEHEQHH